MYINNITVAYLIKILYHKIYFNLTLSMGVEISCYFFFTNNLIKKFIN